MLFRSYTAGNGLETAESTVLEVTDGQDVVWKYISQENESWYRAYRISSLHPHAFSVAVDHNKNTELAGSTVDGIRRDRQKTDLLYTKIGRATGREREKKSEEAG